MALALAFLASCGVVPQEELEDLLHRFRSEEDSARVATARRLREHASSLIALLREGQPEERSELARTLAELYIRESIPALVKLLGAEEPSLRVSGLRALERLRAGELGLHATRLLGDPDPQVRRTAAVAAGSARWRPAVPALSALLNDDDPEVGRAALESLARLEAAEALRPLLADSRSAFVGAAADALSRLGDDASVAKLSEAAGSQDPRRAVPALEALRRMAAKVSPRAVLPQLESDEDQIRAQALLSWVRLFPRQAVGPVRRAMKDPSARVRSAAARAAAELGERDLILPLRGLLEDPEEGVQAVAVRALGETKSAEALQAVLGLTTAENPDVASSAVWAMGRIAPLEEVDNLIWRLKDPRSEVRETSIAILSELGARDAARAIRRLVGDPHPAVRRAAVRALGRLRAPEGVPALLGVPGGEAGDLEDEALISLAAAGGDEALQTLRKTLETPGSPRRLLAAALLVRRGQKDGILALLEEGGRPRDMNALNALRRPAEWKKLDETPFDLLLRGRRREVLARFAHHERFRIELPSAFARLDDAWLDEELERWPDRTTSALDMLESILGERDLSPPLGFVLEAGGIRLVPADELVAFWADWWRQQGRAPK